uniref:Reverse transcriptase domain-containing protein n=1 Tax=Tanacetum cinerariifolium TaxID=118510 RepID=A0A6L2NIN8_TANCI|nr:hypothetical protein [Tanacetum cinerariifolium]
MGDEHLDTIQETKSDELIKSSVENLVPSLSESKDISDGECDLPLCDDSPRSNPVTSFNPLFDSNEDFTSSNNESFSEEDIPIENFKIFSNPLFNLDEEIISTKIDSLLDEFTDELTLLKSIPLGINDDNLDPEGEIHLVERLLYENSSPRPLEELTVENSIYDGFDSEGDNLFIERLLYDDLIPLSEYDHFQFNNEPTYPTLDSDFIRSSDFLGSNLHVSSPSGDKNKIYDPGICI